ncbi:MAG: hypothetical protein WCW17_02450 [Patescibacteria group bacterium]|jgi:hypothetical protein
MAPSTQLPGTDGVIITPKLVANGFKVEQGSDIIWHPVYATGPIEAALCFECVFSKGVETQPGKIALIRRMYKLEDHYCEFLNLAKTRGLSGQESTESTLLGKQITEFCSQLGLAECLFCHETLETFKSPMFMAKMFDRYKARQSPGFQLTGNYQWSNYETGHYLFGVCFGCFSKLYLPSLTKLGYLKS